MNFVWKIYFTHEEMNARSNLLDATQETPNIPDIGRPNSCARTNARPASIFEVSIDVRIKKFGGRKLRNASLLCGIVTSNATFFKERCESELQI